jgi:hypothetical protein
MDYTKLITYTETNLSGRYITLNHLQPLLENLPATVQIFDVGFSVLNKPIQAIKFGTGKTKVFMWSQMHGNESTTTKALFDFFIMLQNEPEIAHKFSDFFTFLIIPIANPDGAEAYMRENAHKIDLNRDMLNLSQPESKVLWTVFNDFKPDYAFNLHDQRTIFAAGNTNNPATVSFLAPSFDENRSINDTRQKAINIISAMNHVLQQFIPNKIGRFDDGFNPNCIGDCFQMQQVPTILIEAGHFPDDYEREETRKYVLLSLIASLQAINENVVVINKIDEYLAIPQNKPIFFDIIYKNLQIDSNNSKKLCNFAIQYKEVLENHTILFEGFIQKIDNLENNFGHIEINCNKLLYTDFLNSIPEVNQRAIFYIGNLFYENKLKNN